MIRRIRSFLLKEIVYYFLNKGAVIIHYIDDRRIIMNRVCELRNEGMLSLRVNEGIQLYNLLESVDKIEGDIVEIGVFKGGSAKLMKECNNNKKTLHLFDTFEGLPSGNEKDDIDKFYKGKFRYGLDKVKEYLKSENNVFFYKGLISETRNLIDKGIRFSFAHIDVDIYQSTLDSLDFVYPRMNEGGIIVSHDYSTVDGVKKAFDEFFKDKKEAILRLASSQCAVVCFNSKEAVKK